MATAIQVSRTRAAQDYDIAQQNADVARRNASSNERNAESNRQNAITNAGQLAQTVARDATNADLKRRELTEVEKMGKSNRTRNTVSNITGLANVANQAASNTVGALGNAAGLIAALNDWNWYVSSEQRLKDVASYPWGDMYGSRYNPKFTTVSARGIAQSFAAPGICSLITAQTIGNASGTYDPVNRAIQMNFDIINRENGRNSDYEAADLGLYMICHASLHSYIQMLRRAYAVMNTVEAKNQYVPRRLLEEMGFDYDDMLKHIYDFKGHINWLIDQVSVLPVIPGWSLGVRWMYEMTYVFRDDHAEKSQIYFYVPHHFFKLDVTGEATAALEKRWVSLSGTVAERHTYDQVVAFSNDLLNAFIGMQDVRIMRADIERAYGREAFISLPYVTSSDKLNFAVDYLSLDQFRNATIMGDADSFSIMQDSESTIKSNPLFKKDTGKYRQPAEYLITTSSVEASAVNTIEAARLMIPVIENGGYYAIQGFAHSVPICIRYIGYAAYAGAGDITDTSSSEVLTIQNSPIFINVADTADYTEVEEMALATFHTACFGYSAPMFFAVSNVENGTESIYFNHHWDNSMQIDRYGLKRMNDAIALHMLTAKTAVLKPRTV